MKTFLILLAAAGAAVAQNLSDLPPLPKARPKEKVDWNALVRVSPETEWKDWIASNFPDRSGQWPPEAVKAFGAAAGDEKWDYVAKGDFDRDGKPTALLVRFADSAHATIVTALIITKWRNGKWTPMLSMEEDKGVKMNGDLLEDLSSPRFHGYVIDLGVGNRKDPKHPGMFTYVEMANRKGVAMTESVQFYLLAKEQKYAVDR